MEPRGLLEPVHEGHDTAVFRGTREEQVQMIGHEAVRRNCNAGPCAELENLRDQRIDGVR
jgi:hypothetical protein